MLADANTLVKLTRWARAYGSAGQDIVQEVVLNLIKRNSPVRGSSDRLLRVALKHGAIDYFRKRGAKERGAKLTVVLSEAEEQGAPMMNDDSSVDLPERLTWFLCALTNRELEIYDLSLDGLSQVQIARRLGVNKSGVNKAMASIRTKYREIVVGGKRPPPRPPSRKSRASSRRLNKVLRRSLVVAGLSAEAGAWAVLPSGTGPPGLGGPVMARAGPDEQWLRPNVVLQTRTHQLEMKVSHNVSKCFCILSSRPEARQTSDRTYYCTWDERGCGAAAFGRQCEGRDWAARREATRRGATRRDPAGRDWGRRIAVGKSRGRRCQRSKPELRRSWACRRPDPANDGGVVLPPGVSGDTGRLRRKADLGDRGGVISTFSVARRPSRLKSLL